MAGRLLFAVLGLLLVTSSAGAGMRYVDSPGAASWDAAVDTRPEAACAEHPAALPAATVLCLPPEVFLGPHRRLVGPYALLWRLGTVGLTGSEKVLVVGDDAVARDFVAAVLHLAGQAEVTVLRPATGGLEAAGASPVPVRPGMVRETVYRAPMRDEALVLRHELAERLGAGGVVLLDGRAEDEYWGRRVRGRRGGRIPGAQSLPAVLLRDSLHLPAPQVLAPPEGSRAIAYAHDAVEGLAYFTLLTAGARLNARIYAEGWAEWAASALPADGVTHPDGEERS